MQCTHANGPEKTCSRQKRNNIKTMKLLFNFLIFPGFVFTACVGLIAGWLDRKVSARLQWRVGPPWHQNFSDILKLLGKENIIPQTAGAAFMAAPYLGLIGVVLASNVILGSVFMLHQSFHADLIVAVYLLIIPALALIIGGSSSGNPLASVGSSREMKLVLAYELPFLLALITVIIKSSGLINLSTIIDYQNLTRSFIFSWSGLLAFIVSIFCMQAKLGLVPFDISEAEQEIMAGVLIEYSGLGLALFKLIKASLLCVMPAFLIVMFMGKDLSLPLLAAKYIGILVVIILIKNTNPRLRIDQALRFFWGPVTLLAVLAVVLALFGL